MFRGLITAMFCLAVAVSWAAEPTPVSLTPNGQVRVRMLHHQGADFAAGNTTNTLHQRTRFGLHTAVSEQIGLFLQLQDVRVWGEELDPLRDGNAEALDMHQAYGILRPTDRFEIRLGRQELHFLNQRILGEDDWFDSARSFDGLRLRYGRDSILFDVFYSHVSEDVSTLGDLGTVNMEAIPNGTDQDLVGLWFQFKASPSLEFNMLKLADMDEIIDHMRFTTGILVRGDLGRGVDYSVEGYYQFGEREEGIRYNSYLAALELGMLLPVIRHPRLALFAEAVSGDDDLTDSTEKVFSAPYASSHRFYGLMDYFRDLPGDTAYLGLLDVGAKITWSPLSSLRLELVAHHFRSMVESADGYNYFGSELDFTTQYKLMEHTWLELWYSGILPGALLTNTRPGDGMEHRGGITFDMKL